MSEVLSVSPTSRICLKNLPTELDEHTLRRMIVTETKKAGIPSKVPIVEVTEVRLLRNKDGVSRKMAFIGFQTIEQSEIAQLYWNKAYVKGCRISANFSAPPGSKDLHRPWSKYSEGSSKMSALELLKQREQIAQQLRQDKSARVADILPSSIVEASTSSISYNSNTSGTDKETRRRQLQALSRHPALLGLSEADRERVLDDPRFHDFMTIVISRRSKNNKFWDNNDQTAESKSLRAMYLATTGQDAASQNESTITYEDLMDDLKKNEKNGEKNGENKKADVDSDSEDEDYFSNPSFERSTLFSSDPTERREMDDMIGDILTTETTAHTATDDADYFKKMQSSNFDDDSDEESDNSDDNSDDDNEGPRKRKKKVHSDDEEEVELPKPVEEDEKVEERPSEIVMKLSEEESKALILETGRLFVRNLALSVTENDLDDIFHRFGTISELSIPLNYQGISRGYAYITYTIPENAVEARVTLNKSIVRGRIMHILPGVVKKDAKQNTGFDVLDPFAGLGDDEIRNLDYKTKKLLTEKAQAQVGHNWNTLFLNSDTVAAAISSKFNMDKRTLLGLDDDEAMDGRDGVAVKMAVAETHMIQETQKFLEESGVNLDSFSKLASAGAGLAKASTASTSAKNITRSTTAILFKNLSHETTVEDIKKECQKYGKTTRIILPPYKTLAIVEFASQKEAKRAFVSLAYRRFLNLPLYLEWAPEGCLSPMVVEAEAETKPEVSTADLYSLNKTTELDDAKLAELEEFDNLPNTLYIKNLAEKTTGDQLRAAVAEVCEVAWKRHAEYLHARGQAVPGEYDRTRWKVRSATIATNATGSMGYGFVEMSSGLAAAGVANEASKQRGIILDDRNLEVTISVKRTTVEGSDATSAIRKKTSILKSKGLLPDEEKLRQQEEWSKRSTKLIVRNVPFEATVRDVRELFQAFSQVKRIRLPKKDGSPNSHRGFAFVDFVTAQEARVAFKALQSTHLYGRHLVIEWAKPDETLEELREKTVKNLKTQIS